MLRPLFREADYVNWKKASVQNKDWVSFLSEEDIVRFYGGPRKENLEISTPVDPTPIDLNESMSLYVCVLIYVCIYMHIYTCIYVYVF
jgi:hypothetical protein